MVMSDPTLLQGFTRSVDKDGCCLSKKCKGNKIKSNSFNSYNLLKFGRINNLFIY